MRDGAYMGRQCQGYSDRVDGGVKLLCNTLCQSEINYSLDLRAKEIIHLLHRYKLSTVDLLRQLVVYAVYLNQRAPQDSLGSEKQSRLSPFPKANSPTIRVNVRVCP